MNKLKPIDLEVIRALADSSMNIAETARKIYSHRSTVEYHIARIQRITGLDPLNFYDLIKLLELAKEAE